jgi:hypothetical protein
MRGKMMKWFALLILSSVCWTCVAQEAPKSTLSKADWLADLDYASREMPRRHKNLFHSMSRVQFEHMIASLRARVPTLNDHQIAVEFARIASTIADSHSGVSSIPEALQAHRYPFRAYSYADGVFIQAIAPQYAQFSGSSILAIDGYPANVAMRRVRTVSDGTNDMSRRDFAVFRLNKAEVLQTLGITKSAEAATFLLEKDRVKTNLKLTPMTMAQFRKPSGLWDWMGANPESDWVDARRVPAPLYLKDQTIPFVTVYLRDSKTLYVRCNVIGDTDKTLLANFEDAIGQTKQNPVDHFVIDLRMNGGGDNTLLRPIIHALVRSDDINKRGKLFAIIGRRTQSAAENFVTLLELDTNAILVGEPTGESPNQYGDPIALVLPHSGLTINLASLYWQDAGPHDSRIWTGPEIAAELTSTEYANGVDPALNAIISYQVEPRFENVLGDLLFQRKSLQDALDFYRVFREQPAHKFFDTERVVLDLADSLDDQHRYSDEVALLKMNAEYYPNSAESYVKLGAALERMGNRKDAALAYARAVKLDPACWAALDRLKGQAHLVEYLSTFSSSGRQK